MSKKNTLQQNKDITYTELLSRTIAAGKQIYVYNKEENLNKERAADAEKEAKMLENLMKPIFDRRGKILKEGLTYEQAMKIIEENNKLKN
jgi:hypothetical protein